MDVSAADETVLNSIHADADSTDMGVGSSTQMDNTSPVDDAQDSSIQTGVGFVDGAKDSAQTETRSAYSLVLDSAQADALLEVNVVGDGPLVIARSVCDVASNAASTITHSLNSSPRAQSLTSFSGRSDTSSDHDVTKSIGSFLNVADTSNSVTLNDSEVKGLFRALVSEIRGELALH